MDVRIHHVLKDGTQVDDIAGKVIKADQFPVLYEVVNRIQKEGRQTQHEQTYNNRHC